MVLGDERVRAVGIGGTLREGSTSVSDERPYLDGRVGLIPESRRTQAVGVAV
jgi:hypothetical protein